MNRLLCRLFIKDYKNYTDPEVRQKYGLLSGIVGLLTNLLLFTIKLIAGILSGSIAIIADAVNNLSDASSSIITLVGFCLSSMPEDKDHPFGHARIEYITGIIISVLIVVVGVELGKESAYKIFHPEAVKLSPLILAILIISIVTKLWQGSFYGYAGKVIDSITLKASKRDSLNDVFATSSVLVAVTVGDITGYHLDGYMGAVVALFIIFSGISLTKETVSPLLGEKPDPNLVNDIKTLALSYDGVLGIHDLVVHNYGPGRTFVSIHIEVDAKGDLMESHDLIDNIERDLSAKLNIVMTAHMDPIVLDDPEATMLKKNALELSTKIPGVSDLHDFRMVKGPSHTNLIFDLVISPSCALTKKEILSQFQRLFSKIDSKYYVVIDFDGEYSNLNG